MLKAFVGDILGIERGIIQSVTVINPNVLSDDADGKQSQLDLSMIVDDKIVNVEIQLSNKGDFVERSLYYWAKLYSDQLKSGDPYEELKRTITINILDFNLFKWNDNAYSSFSLREKERNEFLTDKCSINFFELLKVGKEIDKDNLKQLWLQLLKAETEEDLNMLNETEVPEIKKAVVFLHEMSADEELREKVRNREKRLHDEASARLYDRREGIKEGIEEMIEKMRRSGMSEEQINNVLNS